MRDFSIRIDIEASNKDEAVAALERAVSEIKAGGATVGYGGGGNAGPSVSVYAGTRMLSVRERIERLEAGAR